jgi:hypothetical protein
MTPIIRVIDSITELSAADQGCIAVSGSHGGASAAAYARMARPMLSVFNDAGVGKDDAGIAGLEMLQAEGLAACTVSHHSACIGQARSTLDEGIVSHTNPLAQAMGIHPGMSIRACLERLASASH